MKSLRLLQEVIDSQSILITFGNRKIDAFQRSHLVVQTKGLILTWTFSQCFGFLIILNTSFWIIVTILVFFNHSCFVSFVIFCSWSFNRTTSCGPWGPTTIITFLVLTRNYKTKKNIKKKFIAIVTYFITLFWTKI